MSPKHYRNLSDSESETTTIRIGRPSTPLIRILDAADGLLADAGSPQTVTMDDIAAAAGIGKGTLFRAFGSRDGLLDALWTEKLAALRQDVEEGEAPLGPGTPSLARIVAFLDALFTFKLENRHLIRMRERDPARIRQATNYRWSHGLLQVLIEDAAPKTTPNDAGYVAHVLLAALDINLVDELLASGRSPEDVRRSQAALALALINGASSSFGCD